MEPYEILQKVGILLKIKTIEIRNAIQTLSMIMNKIRQNKCQKSQ